MLKKYFSLICLVTLGLSSNAIASDTSCPSISQIKVNNGHYVAHNGAGDWISESLASKSNPQIVFFWQADGKPVVGHSSKLVAVNQLICVYELSNNSILTLKSPGYPSKQYLVENRTAGGNWDYTSTVIGYAMNCMGSSASSCSMSFK